MEAQSIDYANLIRRYTLQKYGVSLVKTQVLKILYIIYGMYLAKTGNKLFSDDQLQAWPYGPVFPRVYRLYKEQPGMLSEEALQSINTNSNAVSLIKNVIDKRHNWTAYQLSEWSHQVDGPWYNTVYSKDGETHWGATIKDDLINEYFKTYSL